jgi:rhodanese-related sulfurtransferase
MVEQVTVGQLAALDRSALVLVDVREEHEFAAGRIPGAVNIPMATIPGALADLPSDGSLYLVCEVGARSARVAAYLETQGIPAINVAGGTSEWRLLGGPVET